MAKQMTPEQYYNELLAQKLAEKEFDYNFSDDFKIALGMAMRHLSFMKIGCSYEQYAEIVLMRRPLRMDEAQYAITVLLGSTPVEHNMTALDYLAMLNNEAFPAQQAFVSQIAPIHKECNARVNAKMKIIR